MPNNSSHSSSARACARCGTLLGPDAPGSACWSCMIAVATAAPEPDAGSNGTHEARPPEAASDPVPTETGQRLGDYLLERQIAHGGMGVVYRARQLSLDRTVAVKLLLLGRYSSADSIARFRREAQSAAALRHPNIVAIHDVGEHQGQSFLAMEYLPGGSLADVLRGGPLPFERAARYAHAIAQAIHHAHGQGVLHRDLKPSNVLIGDHGEVRVTDFGLAKKLDGTNDLTLTGQMVGTPNYLSPEAAAGRNEEVGPLSDVYAIGAVLYECLTGRPPFLAPSLSETLIHIRDTDPVAPRALNPAVPRDLETIALKCLEKSPARRYASAEALAADLDRWLRQEPIQARPVGVFERGWKWAKRKPKAAALLATTLIAVGAFIASLTVMNVRVGRANRQLSENVRDLEWQKAEDLEWQGKPANALARFSRLLRDNPRDEAAASRILSLLSLRKFALPTSEPLSHDGKLVKAELSPNGRWVLTASTDGTARIWDADTSRELIVVRPGNGITDAAFVSQGERFVTLQRDGCQLWEIVGLPASAPSSAGETHGLVGGGGQTARAEKKEAPSARLIAQFPRHSESRDPLVVSRDRRAFAFGDGSHICAYDAVSGKPLGPTLSLPGYVWMSQFSPDGRALLTSAFDSAHDGYVSVWDIATGQSRLGPLRAKRPSVAFAPDGAKIVVASTDGILSVFDATTGQERARNPNMSGDPVGLKISADGQKIITALWGKAVRIWSMDTLEATAPPLEGVSDGCIVDVSPDSRTLVTGSRDGQLKFWDLATGVGAGEAFGHDGPISSVRFADDGSRVVTASEDGTGRVWNTRLHVAVTKTLGGQGDSRAIAFLPDGQRLVSTAQNYAQLVDARTLQPIGKPMSHAAIFTSGLSADGRLLFTASFFGAVRLWDVSTGEPIGEPLAHGADVWACAFSRDARRLVSTSRDMQARVWDVATSKLVFPPIAHPDEVNVVKISPDQERFVTGCLDAGARLWSLANGSSIGQPMRHRGLIWDINFNPEGTLIATASADTTARLWDGRTGASVGRPMKHDRGVLSVSFSPDGQRVLTSSEEGAARVWDTRTCEPVSRWMHHYARIWAAQFSPDGKLVATASDDHSVRLWDAETGYPMSEPFFHAAECRRLSFSPDGTRLAAGSTDGVISIWDVRRAPAPVPAWFIDLVDAMAGRRLGPHGEIERVPDATLHELREKLSHTDATDFYSNWGRRFFQEQSGQ